MKIYRLIGSFAVLLSVACSASAQSYDLQLVDIPAGTATLGEDESSYLGPPGSYDAPVHTVTLGAFRMSETEVTNQQYVGFLNAALEAGLVEVRVETAMGPDAGSTLVYGSASAPADYTGVAITNLSGTRVMKDHDNGDGDDDEFTGVIEPENPLNLSYIGYDESRSAGDRFYVKDPRDANDFDWEALTNYYNYSAVARQLDTSVELNDYASWPELADYPNNLPSLSDVQNWPATFIRWYGAKAFALFYEMELPTEAEWEYASQGDAAFVFATDDGLVDGDGTSANWNHLLANPSQGHVLDAKQGAPNPYGLYNLAGNVWEWIEDWYDAGFYADGTDPVNTTDSGVRVRRGGSWNYHQSTLKTAARAKDEPFKGNDHFGFRVVSHEAVDVGLDDPGQLPGSPGLLGSYPNPFSASTAIAYQSDGSVVRMEVFDLLGRRVATVVDGFRPPGTQTVRFDAKGLPDGVFVVRLTAGGKTDSRIVLRAR